MAATLCWRAGDDLGRRPSPPSVWPPRGALAREVIAAKPPRVSAAFSDGAMEASGAELVHFTHQSAFLTELPTIYHPHDLQHIHLPEYFSERDLRNRAGTYETLARRAAVVAVATSWVKQDVVEHLGISEEKVSVVPLAPFVAAYARAVCQRFRACSSRAQRARQTGSLCILPRPGHTRTILGCLRPSRFFAMNTISAFH